MSRCDVIHHAYYAVRIAKLQHLQRVVEHCYERDVVNALERCERRCDLDVELVSDAIAVVIDFVRLSPFIESMSHT